MNDTDDREPRRFLVPLVVLVVLAGLAATYRAELGTWFRDAAPAGERGDATASDAHAHDDGIAYYTCSMHPSVRAETPGQCPICSMDLTPVTEEELATGVLRVDGHRTQELGVRYATVQRADLTREVTAVGEVTADENRLTDVTLRTAGWVDELLVAETGEAVEAGQILLRFYSPDVLTASEEVLAARRAGGMARDHLLSASERKLRLLGVSQRQLDRLVDRGHARDRIVVTSPASGFVVERDVVEGDFVERGATLLRIADLSVVWVDLQIYEADLPFVAVGQPVRVTLPFGNEASFEGEIGYIHPRLDPRTRTVSARVVLDNPELALRPGMYAQATIEVDLGTRLVVPREAVVFTGPRRLVFVDLGQGRLQPTEVELGVTAGDRVEVRAGLDVGQRVVASGNFLLAAESRIRSATTIWATAPDTAEADTGDAKGPGSRTPASTATAYTCPMHPQVHADAPGECPICHMALVPADEGGAK